MIVRRLACAGIAACAIVAAAPAASQQYPTKPVRVIIPFAPGGGSDITARLFSTKLSEYMGQQFIPDNRGGAGGLIGMEATARSAPDGYTIMMMSASFAATSAVQRPAFDPVNNIVPVAEFGVGRPGPPKVRPARPVPGPARAVRRSAGSVPGSAGPTAVPRRAWAAAVPWSASAGAVGSAAGRTRTAGQGTGRLGTASEG